MNISIKRNAKEQSEHSLQVHVLLYLSVKGKGDVFAFAIPNAARRSLRMGRRMKSEGMMAGVADLCIMLPDGKVAWLELKAGRRGKQSLNQMGFEARCQRLMHPYCVARTTGEAEAFLDRIGALK